MAEPRKVVAHEFRETHHHPIVQISSHVISPLTASLFIFGVHKACQAPAAAAMLRAWSLSARARLRRYGAGASGSASGPMTGSGISSMRPVAAAEAASGARGFASSAAGVNGPSAASHMVQPEAVTPAPAARRAALAATGAVGAASAVAGASSTAAEEVLRAVGLNSSSADAPSATAASTASAASPGGRVMTLEPDLFDPSRLVEEASTEGLVESEAQVLDEALRHNLNAQHEHADEMLLHQLEELYAPEQVPLVAEHVFHAFTVDRVEALLHRIHDSWHLPWWGTIVATTLMLRAAMAFVQVSLLRNSLRMELIKPEVDRLDAILQSSSASTAAREAAAEELLALFRQHQCSPFKQAIVFPLLLPPTILSIFGAIHNISLSVPSMAHEGLLWFPDLVASDTTNLLPIISGLTWLWNVELGAGIYYHAWHTPKVAARAIAVASIPLTATLPSGALLFWVTSNLFAVARTYALRNDQLRKTLRIPLQREIDALDHTPKIFHP